MGNTKNKRVETTSQLTPGSEKIGPKIQKTKKSTPLRQIINKKNNKALDKQRRKTRAQPRRPLMMRCTVPPGSHCTLKQRKWPAAHVLAAATLMALGPQPECHPVPCLGASVGAENRGSTSNSCPACTPRPFYCLCTKTLCTLK